MARKKQTDPVVESLARALQELFTAMMCHCVMHSGPDVAIEVLSGLKTNIEDQIADVRQLAENAANPHAEKK